MDFRKGCFNDSNLVLMCPRTLWFFVPESCHILKLKLEAQTFVTLNLENRKLIEEVVSRRNCFRVQNVPFSCEVYPDPGNCWPDYVSSLQSLMSGFWTEECHGSWELLEAEKSQPMRCVTLPEVLKEKSFHVVAKLLHTSECLWIPLNIMNNLWQVSKRGLAVTAARRADQVMPDPVEHATGKTFGWLLAYQIIVANAADAVSVNFSGRCKFLQI